MNLSQKDKNEILSNNTGDQTSMSELGQFGGNFSARKDTLRIVSYFLLFGTLWVLLSDIVLSWIIDDPKVYMKIQTYKGWFFVFITAGLIYSLVYTRMRFIVSANKEIVKANDVIMHNYDNLTRIHEEVVAKDRELMGQRELLQQKAFFDDMTGLPNRNSFSLTLDNIFTDPSERASRGFTMLLVDIDNFKYINDSLGYSAGDEFLKYLAKTLEALVVAPNVIARVGGDEFAIILYDVVEKEAVVDFVNNIKESINETWMSQGLEFYISFSIGINPCSDRACNQEDIYRYADMALHKAKLQGKNQYVFFTEEIKKENLAKIDLVGSIKVAIEREEFILHYQPQFNLDTDEIVGVEALIRWPHPIKGNISPMEFIPLAEETGLIYGIEYFVFEQAIEQLLDWKAKSYSDIKMSINLSSKSLMNEISFRRIEEILDSYKYDKSDITVEITETAIITDVQVAMDNLGRLRARGINVALDDFGTGFSSLTYLKDLPINIVKLDSSYSVSVDGESSDSFIVKSILQLSHKLGYAVVAEGIEEDSQRVQLREYGCIYGQGYLYSRPLPALEVERLFLVEKDS